MEKKFVEKKKRFMEKKVTEVEGREGGRTENESSSPSMERNAIHLSQSLTNSSPYGSHKSNLNKPAVI